MIRSFVDFTINSCSNANVFCVVRSRLDNEWKLSRGWPRIVRNVYEDGRHEAEMGGRYSTNHVSRNMSQLECAIVSKDV